MSPRWDSTLRLTDWLNVSRNVTLTLTLILSWVKRKKDMICFAKPVLRDDLYIVQKEEYSMTCYKCNTYTCQLGLCNWEAVCVPRYRKWFLILFIWISDLNMEIYSVRNVGYWAAPLHTEACKPWRISFVSLDISNTETLYPLDVLRRIKTCVWNLFMLMVLAVTTPLQEQCISVRLRHTTVSVP
jgi:hypothetical protein